MQQLFVPHRDAAWQQVPAWAAEVDRIQAERLADTGRSGDEAYIQRIRTRTARIADLEKLIHDTIAPATETHQWTHGRGKLGVGKAQITASRNSAGWRYDASNHTPGWRVCGLIVTVPGCRELATWQVTRWKQHATYIGRYCDDHARDEDLPVAFGGDGDCRCETCTEIAAAGGAA